jgi:hypothetical protein
MVTDLKTAPFLEDTPITKKIRLHKSYSQYDTT